jgi:ABC-type glycerol-3-phosphate transport system substrate-binding protein
MMPSPLLSRRTFLRAVSLASVAGSAALLLAACQAPAPQPTAAPAPTATPAQAAAAPKQTSLQVWWEDSWTTKDVWENILKKFSDKHPGVTLVSVPVPFDDIQTKVLTSLAGGLQLDILYSHPVLNATLASKGALTELDSYIKGSSLNLNDFFEMGLLQHRWKGKLYSIPMDHECNLYYYNTDSIKKAGLEDPAGLYKQGKWNLDKFIEHMGALSKGTGADRVFGSQEIPQSLRIWDVWIWGRNGDVFAEDYTATRINEEVALPAWDFFADHIRKGWSPTADEMKAFPDGANGLFNSAKLSFRNSIRAYVWTVKEGLPVSMVPHPVMPNGKEYARIGTDAMGIYSKTADRDVAWQALEYIVPNGNDGLIAAQAASPNRKSVYKTDTWLKSMLKWEIPEFYEKIAFNARGLLLPPGFSEIDKRAKTGYQKISLNQATAKQAMDEAKTQIDALLKEAMQ